MPELARRVFGNKDARMTFTAAAGFVANAAYALLNLALGMLSASAWLGVMGLYYMVLGMMRFAIALMRVFGSRRPGADRRCARVVGAAMLVMTFALSGVVLLAVSRSERLPGNQILVITQATYTFTMLGIAIRGLVAAKTGAERIQRDVSAVAALVSMLTLEVTMIDTFGAGQEDFRFACTALFGTFVCASCAFFAARLLAGRETPRLSCGESAPAPSSERTKELPCQTENRTSTSRRPRAWTRLSSTFSPRRTSSS